MHYRLYLYIREPVRTQYQLYLQDHYPDYTIIKPDTEDLSDRLEKKAGDKEVLPVLLLCDRDVDLQVASDSGLARIAIRHDLNKDQDLMKAPWMVDSPQALTPDFLYEVCCRHDHIPLTILETDRCRLRELTSKDLDMLLALQDENKDKPSACFFPDTLFTNSNSLSRASGTDANKNRADAPASEYLNRYIRHQYPFYGYGFYAIEYDHNRTGIGIAGFYQSMDPAKPPAASDHLLTDPKNRLVDSMGDPPAPSLCSVEIGYAIMKKFQGRGIMSEILPALVRYGTDHFGFNDIIARIKGTNNPSTRLARKCGLHIV